MCTRGNWREEQPGLAHGPKSYLIKWSYPSIEVEAIPQIAHLYVLSSWIESSIQVELGLYAAHGGPSQLFYERQIPKWVWLFILVSHGEPTSSYFGAGPTSWVYSSSS